MAEKLQFSLQNMAPMPREFIGEGLLNLFLRWPGIVLRAQGGGTEMTTMTGVTTGGGAAVEVGIGTAMIGIPAGIEIEAIVIVAGAAVTVLITVESVIETTIMMRGIGADLLRVLPLGEAASVLAGACLLPGAFPRIGVPLIHGV